MDKFPKRKSTRLKNYDYSDNGVYFITVCSKDRNNIFGKYNNTIVGEGLAPSRYKYKIKLTNLGQIIDNPWNDLPDKFDNIQLDQYIIMPNHIHSILIIDKRTGASPVPTLQDIIGSFKSRCSVEYLKFINEITGSGTES